MTNHNSTNHNSTSCSVLHDETHDLSKIRGFKIASLNINSLSKHIDELQVFMKDGIFDVLAINETKLDLFDPDSLIDLPGYTCIRKDRNKAGGGVCIYVRNSINFTRKPNLEDRSLEMITIEIKKPYSDPYFITTWYRPPKSPVELFDRFEEILIKLDASNKNSTFWEI